MIIPLSGHTDLTAQCGRICGMLSLVKLGNKGNDNQKLRIIVDIYSIISNEINFKYHKPNVKCKLESDKLEIVSSY